jgi:hypothetical protein
MSATGIRPKALAVEPATIQEKCFARLYFLKAVIFVVLPTSLPA